MDKQIRDSDFVVIDYYRVSPRADRSDSGRGSDQEGGAAWVSLERLVSTVALWTGGGLLVWGDHKCILRFGADPCATAAGPGL